MITNKRIVEETERIKEKVDSHHQNYDCADCSINNVVIRKIHKLIYKEGNYKKADCAQGCIENAEKKRRLFCNFLPYK